MREQEYADLAVKAKADEYAKLAEEAKIKAEKEETDRKHSELLEAVKTSPQAIVEAVKAIPKTEIEIPDHTKEQKQWKQDIIEAIQNTVENEPDYSDIIKAIKAVKFPDIKIPEHKDYTKLLQEIKKSLPENTDLSLVEKLLSEIKPFEIPEKLLTKDGKRLKVEVDRIAVGGGGSGDTSKLATEETLLDVKTAIENIVVPAPVGGATEAAQTDGTQKTQIVDAGGDAVTVTGGKLDVNASVDTTGLATSAKQLPDGHEVEVNNFPVEYPLPAAQVATLTPPAAISGFATEAKQLPDGHNVTVDNASIAVTATDLDIRNLTNTDVVTAELSATDNAVLDTIAAKDFATQTTLAAMNAKMVTGTDIGDVTINNASGASAVNIQDGGNTITVDGTVTANLSATDNQVLDDISADTGNIDTKLGDLVGFEIPAYDYIALTYVAAGNGAGEIETVVYKTGGSAGTTVATLTLAYDANDKLSTVTKT